MNNILFDFSLGINKSFIWRVTGVDRVELARGRQLGRTTLMARSLNVKIKIYIELRLMN